MHFSQALSRSHSQPILMPRTPPWRKGPGLSAPPALQIPVLVPGAGVTRRRVISLHFLGRGRRQGERKVTCLRCCSEQKYRSSG